MLLNLPSYRSECSDGPSGDTWPRSLSIPTGDLVAIRFTSNVNIADKITDAENSFRKKDFAVRVLFQQSVALTPLT